MLYRATCVDYRGFSVRFAALGDMPCCAEASDIDCHGAGSTDWFEDMCRLVELYIRCRQKGFTSILLAGAVCSSAASTDLCWGWWVTIVPTATDATSSVTKHVGLISWAEFDISAIGSRKYLFKRVFLLFCPAWYCSGRNLTSYFAQVPVFAPELVKL